MDPQDLEKLGAKIQKDLKQLNDAFRSVVNGTEPIEAFAEAIEDWKEKRQKYNDRNIGIIIGVETFKIITFPISGDAVKDLGQYNSKKNVDNTDFKNDKDFLKKLKIKPDITPDDNKKP